MVLAKGKGKRRGQRFDLKMGNGVSSFCKLLIFPDFLYKDMVSGIVFYGKATVRHGMQHCYHVLAGTSLCYMDMQACW